MIWESILSQSLERPEGDHELRYKFTRQKSFTIILKTGSLTRFTRKLRLLDLSFRKTTNSERQFENVSKSFKITIICEINVSPVWKVKGGLDVYKTFSWASSWRGAWTACLAQNGGSLHGSGKLLLTQMLVRPGKTLYLTSQTKTKFSRGFSCFLSFNMK